jgi:spore coat polysaccharide biosynthesis protein SpsF (cytidylyltransferase family)
VDYLSFTGLPLGITPSILRTEALERAMKIKPPSDTSTGFFRFLQESGQFQVAKVAANNPAHRHPTARLTLDYPQDLIFFSEVYRVLDERGGGWDLAGLVALLHDRPDFVALNQGLDEAYWQHFETGVTKGFSA